MELNELLGRSATLFAAAFVADIVLGDPVYCLHPIRLIGQLVSLVETFLRRIGLSGYLGGIMLFLIVSVCAVGIAMGPHIYLYTVDPHISFAWDLYVAWSMLALGDLARHGSAVGRAVAEGSLERAREATGMLVGRDLTHMEKEDCCRAAIESLSENLTDGVISPMFYLFLFGLPGLVVFKVASTLDSMVGYKNERYRKFGWCGARMDDVLNFVPARLTWLVMSFVSAILPGFRGRRCFAVGLRQHAVMPGPNSGWSEAAAAGALGLRLVGPIWREDVKVTEVWLGDSDGCEHANPTDIRRMIVLDYVAAGLFLLVGCLLKMWT